MIILFLKRPKLSESQGAFEHSKEFELGDFFLRNWRFVDFQAFFKTSLYLE